MDSRKVIIASYLAVALVLWFLSRHGVQYLYQHVYDIGRIPGIIYLKEVIPFILGISTFLVLLKHPRVNPFMDEVVSEVRRVTWPARPDVIRSTIVVLACIVVASVILGFFDFGWGHVVSFILKS